MYCKLCDLFGELCEELARFTNIFLVDFAQFPKYFRKLGRNSATFRKICMQSANDYIIFRQHSAAFPRNSTRRETAG